MNNRDDDVPQKGDIVEELRRNCGVMTTIQDWCLITCKHPSKAEAWGIVNSMSASSRKGGGEESMRRD
ncbi:hypothetical protein AMTR_s00010p00238860 [Amborella trichopoda]|uniref:Uncharacterized protein n=1 Tax=Amborella trichopoda TaxID=13333 RepID=W1NGN5_AMBTC|nr:hypothetical protein AMTR_s00010p00238860 [Amborella trichopoda]